MIEALVVEDACRSGATAWSNGDRPEQLVLCPVHRMSRHEHGCVLCNEHEHGCALCKNTQAGLGPVPGKGRP